MIPYGPLLKVRMVSFSIISCYPNTVDADA
jgi:hypothetical protein